MDCFNSKNQLLIPSGIPTTSPVYSSSIDTPSCFLERESELSHKATLSCSSVSSGAEACSLPASNSFDALLLASFPKPISTASPSTYTSDRLSYSLLESDCVSSTKFLFENSVSSSNEVQNNDSSPFQQKVFHDFIKSSIYSTESNTDYSTIDEISSLKNQKFSTKSKIHNLSQNRKPNSRNNIDKNEHSLNQYLDASCENPFRRRVFDSFVHSEDCSSNVASHFSFISPYRCKSLHEASAGSRSHVFNKAPLDTNKKCQLNGAGRNDWDYVMSSSAPNHFHQLRASSVTSSFTNNTGDNGSLKIINNGGTIINSNCLSNLSDGSKIIKQNKQDFIYSKMCQKRCKALTKKYSKENISSSASLFVGPGCNIDLPVRSLKTASQWEMQRPDCRSFVVKFSLGSDDEQIGENQAGNCIARNISPDPLECQTSNERSIPKVLTLIELAKNSSIESDLCEGDGAEMTKQLKQLAISSTQNDCE